MRWSFKDPRPCSPAWLRIELATALHNIKKFPQVLPSRIKKKKRGPTDAHHQVHQSGEKEMHQVLVPESQNIHVIEYRGCDWTGCTRTRNSTNGRCVDARAWCINCPVWDCLELGGARAACNRAWQRSRVQRFTDACKRVRQRETPRMPAALGEELRQGWMRGIHNQNELAHLWNREDGEQAWKQTSGTPLV